MAVACPVDLDTGRLRQEIQAIYSRVATDPSGGFHFHRGPVYAAERLGYEASALAALPEWTTASFAGVANPLRMAALAPGATVVDIGCGAGMDLMLAASAVGPGGKAIGIDMTEPMAERARAAADALGFSHVEVRTGDALDLPVDSDSVDVVITNGVLNLAPDKRQAFGERHDHRQRCVPDPQAWWSVPVCGHHRGERTVRVDQARHRLMDRLNRRRSAGGRAQAVLEDIGFRSVRVSEYFDPFGGTSKERVARKYGVRGVNVHALKS